MKQKLKSANDTEAQQKCPTFACTASRRNNIKIKPPTKTSNVDPKLNYLHHCLIDKVSDRKEKERKNFKKIP